MAVRMRVCLRWKGRRGRVSGREMMWAVRGEGRLWVRQARARVAWFVGTRLRRSYVLKRVVWALI